MSTPTETPNTGQEPVEAKALVGTIIDRQSGHALVAFSERRVGVVDFYAREETYGRV